MRILAPRFRMVAVVALACCLPLAAAEEDMAKEAPTPMQQMHKALLGIQHNITGSNVKLKRNISGASGTRGEGQEKTPETPAEACCNSHIDYVTKEIRKLVEIVTQLDLWYAEQFHVEAREQLGEIHTELVIVARGMAVFKMANSKVRAQEALDGVIRPFNRLRKAVEALDACCPLEQTLDGRWKAIPPNPMGTQ